MSCPLPLTRPVALPAAFSIPRSLTSSSRLLPLPLPPPPPSPALTRLDYATLLGYLRADPINVWDHDTDFSVLHKGPEVRLRATLFLAPPHFLYLSPPHTPLPLRL